MIMSAVLSHTTSRFINLTTRWLQKYSKELHTNFQIIAQLKRRFISGTFFTYSKSVFLYFYLFCSVVIVSSMYIHFLGYISYCEKILSHPLSTVFLFIRDHLLKKKLKYRNSLREYLYFYAL